MQRNDHQPRTCGCILPLKLLAVGSTDDDDDGNWLVRFRNHIHHTRNTREQEEEEDEEGEGEGNVQIVNNVVYIQCQGIH